MFHSVHASTILPSTIRVIVMPDIEPTRLVGGMPRNGRSLVPIAKCRLVTTSPSTTCSSTVTLRSRKPARQPRIAAFAPSASASPLPPRAVFSHSAWSLKSGA